MEISHLQGLVHSLEAQLDRQKMELTSQLKMRHSDLVHELYGNAFKLKGTVEHRYSAPANKANLLGIKGVKVVVISGYDIMNNLVTLAIHKK